MSPDRRIDFIVIGVQKAGTTALFDHLADDPAIGLSDVKEAHFFDDEAQDWARPDYATYHARFDWSQPAIRGEATPIYAYWPNALERIAAYNPGIRLVLMLRDPVERAWSHWRMEHRRGVETEPFAWCVREGRQRLFDAEPWGHHREYSYVERGFYGQQIERLFGLFPKTQVLLLQAEDLKSDPQGVLGRLNSFLGAPPPPPTAPRAVHVGPEMEAPPPAEAAYLRDVYARDQARLAALTEIRFS
jgi:hypothetical protein